MPSIIHADCEKYRQYHVAYTESDQRSLADGEAARQEKEAWVARGEMTRVDRGYVDKDGIFEVDPVLGAHMMIAQEQAKKQFERWPAELLRGEKPRRRLPGQEIPTVALPEDGEVSLRFPGIDPLGKYSIIEMKFAQREAAVEAVLQHKPPQVQEYVRKLLSDRTDRTSGRVYEKYQAMRGMSMAHRQLTRAAKLCHLPEGSQQLELYAREKESDLAVTEWDKFMQGIEYAVGLKQGPVPQEITDFYGQKLERPLDMALVARGQQAIGQPGALSVDFQNLDHKVLQAAFSEPQNWGKRPPADIIAEQHVPAQVIEGMIPPYARASADRAISPLFAALEQKTSGDINRGDYIMVDGLTVRERMLQEYTAAHSSANGFPEYYRQNMKAKANEYVTGALMAGKRVEMFVPDEYGRIPEKPLQVTKTGYEPSPDRKITLTAWQRFWGKRGFFKEKVAQAAEYQRIQDVRERVTARNAVTQLDMQDGVKTVVKSQYFSQWVKEKGPLPDSPVHKYSASRSALTTMAICRLVMEGHKVEDIYDPGKLRAEKRKAGNEVMTVFSNPDKAVVDKWAGEVLFNGQRLLAEQVNQAARHMDLTSERVILSAAARPYVAAMQTAFDASQEDRHCPAEFVAAAERHAARTGRAGQGSQIAQQLSDGVCTVGLMFSQVRMAQKVACVMASGSVYRTENTDYYSLFRSEALRSEFARRQSADPGKSLCELAKNEEMPDICGLPESKAYQALMEGATSTEAARQEVGKAFLSGQYQSRMHCIPGKRIPLLRDGEPVMRGGKPAVQVILPELTVDAPTKAAAKDTRHQQEIAAAARKNAVPKPAK